MSQTDRQSGGQTTPPPDPSSLQYSCVRRVDRSGKVDLTSLSSGFNLPSDSGFFVFFSSERSCRHTERHQSHLTALVDDSFLQTLLHRDVSLTRMCFHTEQRTNEKTWLCPWRFIKWRSGVFVRVRDIYWPGLHNLFGSGGGGFHFKHLVSQWNFFSSGRTERSCFNVTVKFRVDWKRTAFSVVCFGKEPVCVQVYSTVLYCTCQYYCRYVTMHSTHHTIRFFFVRWPGSFDLRCKHQINFPTRWFLTFREMLTKRKHCLKSDRFQLRPWTQWLPPPPPSPSGDPGEN